MNEQLFRSILAMDSYNRGAVFENRFSLDAVGLGTAAYIDEDDDASTGFFGAAYTRDEKGEKGGQSLVRKRCSRVRRRGVRGVVT